MTLLTIEEAAKATNSQFVLTQDVATVSDVVEYTEGSGSSPYFYDLWAQPASGKGPAAALQLSRVAKPLPVRKSRRK